MPAKLFVGNLSFQATEEDLRELFQQAGTVETVRIITDQFTGRPRGFGFVEMATKEEATKAVEMLNGRLFRDRNLVVDEARPQQQRGPGGGGERGGGRLPRSRFRVRSGRAHCSRGPARLAGIWDFCDSCPLMGAFAPQL